LFAADFAGDRLFTWSMTAATAARVAGAVPSEMATCGGPIRLALTRRYVAVACLFDHAVWLLERGDDGAPQRVAGQIVHDGPLWSVALLERDDVLFVAAGGTEDHPLERRDRVFGYVDSFVYLYALGPGDALTRVAATNVSALGLVTPKAVTLEAREGVPVTTALGYGSDTALELPFGGAPRAFASLPGCATLSVTKNRILCANPLFDAWVELGPTPRFHPARAAAPLDPTSTERLGEALFFTNLMAPDASSEGRLSRFTCETCHFEGGTDGRVHNSGRDDIRVSTRPLFGLFNDAPHFSRAHDRDLTSVCHNEFAVANRGNPVDPWFSVAPARFPWLQALGTGTGTLSPLDLRRALLRFFARFSHEENPFVSARSEPGHFSASERRGAAAFRARCERCHEARLVAREPASRVPFERWEELTLSPSTPIVWARGDYEKTGVVPYVDPQGTRVPSLRRLYLKRPYLTNGSATTLENVLEQVRVSPTAFEHQRRADAAELVPLAADERGELLAFLRLL
jgi:cytochrome c peroxidase